MEMHQLQTVASKGTHIQVLSTAITNTLNHLLDRVYLCFIYQKHKTVSLKAEKGQDNSSPFSHFSVGKTLTINDVKFSSATAFPVMFKSIKFKLSNIKKASQNFVALKLPQRISKRSQANTSVCAKGEEHRYLLVSIE